MEIPKTMTEQLMEAVEKVSRNNLGALIASTSALEQLRTEFNRIQEEQNRMKPKATYFELAMAKLKQDVVKMPVGFEFEIPQVIGADIWSALERGSKLALGKHVKASQDAYGLEFLRTSTSRHAIYRRAEQPGRLVGRASADRLPGEVRKAEPKSYAKIETALEELRGFGLHGAEIDFMKWQREQTTLT